MIIHIYPYYMVITFFIILTYSFEMAAIFVLFIDLLSCRHA